MGCTGRYAEAWQFAAFFCVGGVKGGLHQGANAAASLLNSAARFGSSGVVAGLMLENVTQGTIGTITAVTETTLTATGVTWDTGDAFRVVVISLDEKATIESYLDITSSDIHAALASVGGCDCTLAAWGAGLLAKINIIEAAAFYMCRCASPNLSDEQKRILIDWANGQLEQIRSGKIEICSGATGSDFPAVDWAEQAVEDFSTARILTNRYKRYSQ